VVYGNKLEKSITGITNEINIDLSILAPKTDVKIP